MVIREQMKEDDELRLSVRSAYLLMQAALQDEFEEMLDIDQYDDDIFVDIVADTIDYLKTKVQKTIHEKTDFEVDK